MHSSSPSAATSDTRTRDLQSNEPEWIVCLGGEDWWYHSHAHFDIQIMKRLASRFNILYVCSVGMRMPSVCRDGLFWTRIGRKLRSMSRLLRRVGPRLHVYSPATLPFYQSAWGQTLNRTVLATQLRACLAQLRVRRPLIWVNTPTGWPAVSSLPRSGLVYQRTDDYAAYTFDNFNADFVRRLDHELVCTSDLVLHVSEELHERASQLTRNSILVRQGVDERFFASAGEPSVPADLAALPRPIVGYVGGLDPHKFDTPLVVDVARGLPSVSFALVGVPDPHTEPLRSLPNVHFLGSKPHEQIPAYVKSFDVCMLPTARTEWGLKCRPLKLLEYLAAGKPTISTPTPAAHHWAGRLVLGDDAREWRAALSRILAADPSTARPAEDGWIRSHAWSALGERIVRELAQRALFNTNTNTNTSSNEV